MEQQKHSAGEAVARVQALLASLAEARSETVRLEGRIQRLRDKSTAVTPRYGARHGGGGGAGRGVTELWDLLQDETARLTQQVARLLALQRQVEAWIDLLPKDQWRMVLRWRYLEGMGYPQVAETLEKTTGRSCSETTVYRLHREALQAAAALWPLE